MITLSSASRVLHLAVFFALAGIFASATAAAAEIEPATAARLASKAANGEKIRLILRLRAQAVPLSANQATRTAMRNAIAARQQGLLTRHSGFVNAIKRYRQTPFVALETNALGLDSLLNDIDVESIEEDLPLYLNLTQTPAITRADLAWASGYRGNGQAVAILDTGVDSAHPFFAGKIISEACFSAGGGGTTSLCPNGQSQQTGPGSAKPCAENTLGCYHGTHVAGIAAGKSGVLAGAAGMAPDAGIIAIQVFTRSCDTAGSCSLSAFTSDLGLALDHLYNLRNTYAIAAVNMSLGGGLHSASCDTQSPTLKSLIDSLRAANIATVIASGNDGSTSSISFPACISSAISVGSTGKDNVIAGYSNSSSLVSLLAPGSSIYSSMPGGGYGSASGTSMATPHVAGAWALMKSAKPGATVSEVLTALQSSGLAITDSRNGIVKPLLQLGGTSGAVASLLGLANLLPTASLTSPVNSANFTAPANITLSAAATDADGAITKVEFYNGTSLIATDTNGVDGWSVLWSGVPQGSYALSAKAFDNNGASRSSAISNVLVSAAGNGTNLALNRPASSSSIWAAICAAPKANDGSDNALDSCGGWSPTSADSQPWWQVDLGQAYRITALELVTRQNCCDAPETRQNFELRASNDPNFASYVVVGSQGSTALPFKATWTSSVTDSSGYRYIRATKAGYFFIAELRVFGSPASNQAPTVTLTSPANNASFTAPANITLSATASDADGSITRVEFYNGAALIATDSNGADGWGIAWNALPQGNYVVSAKVFDNSGASTTSALSSITVSAPGSANLALNRPASASSIWADICAAAKTNDGSDNASDNCGGWSPTVNDAQPWWQVDLGQAYRITALELVTRQNCCDQPETRQNFEIRASNDPSFASYVVLGSQDSTALPFKATWAKSVTDSNGYRYIRATKAGYFFVAELRVFGNLTSNQAPTVTLTSPNKNANFTAPANISLNATATDADGSISKVEFFNGTSLIATDTNAADGWSISWNAVAQGVYALSAKAFDNSNAGITSAVTNISVSTLGDPSLVGYWKFDQSSGTSATDVSGYSNNASLVNGPAWTTGKQANGLSFDGVDDYLLVNNSASLAIGQNNGDFSTTFFLYLRRGATGEWRSLVHKGGINQERTFGIWAFNTDNRLVYQVSTTASWGESGASSAQIPLNQWVHIAYTKSGNTLNLYINGVLDSQATLAGSVIGNSGPLYVGKDPWHAGADSLMDEVRVYNRALSAGEIAGLAGI